MSKKKTFENLKNLVLSLNTAEKRDFKKASSFWGDSEQGIRYLLLFDLINEALRENREVDVAGFLARKKVSAKFNRDQLGETANTLYLNLLKSLRGDAHVGRTRREVQNCLSNIHFLYHKRLFDAAREWVERGKSLSDRYELHFYKMELLFWERKLIFGWKIENFEARADEIAVAEARTTEDIVLETKLEAMYSVFRGHGYSNKVITVEKINEQIKVLESNYLQWEAQLSTSSFGCRILYSCALNAAKILLDSPNNRPGTFLGRPLDNQLRLHYFEQVIGIMEKANMLEDDPKTYFRTVSDYIATCIQIGETERAAKAAHLLPADPKSPDFLQFTIYARLLLLFRQKNYPAAKKFIDENKIGDILDNSAGKIADSRYLFICFYAALTAYKCNDFKGADQFFQRMYNAEQKGAILVLTLMARTVEVFIEVRRETHLKGPTFYEKILQELRTELEGSNHFHGFHKTLWEALRSLPKTPGPASAKAICQKLHQEAASVEHAEMWQLLVEWLAELHF